MQISVLRTRFRLEFTHEGQTPAYIDLALRFQDLSAKSAQLEREVRDRLGLPVGAELPGDESLRATMETFLGTVVAGWGGWTDDDGKPLPDRDEEGNLHIANGRTLLSVDRIFKGVNAKLAALAKAETETLEDAQGN